VPSGRLELNGTHQPLICDDDGDVYLLGENRNMIKSQKFYSVVVKTVSCIISRLQDRNIIQRWFINPMKM
jgi:hypothetical protein